jgi:hypothetical protein
MSHETEVLAAEERRYRAMEAGAWIEIGTLLDDELLYSHSDSSSDTKASYIDLLRQGVYAYDSVTSSERSVICVGASLDIALCCGRMRMRGRLNGSPKEIDNRYLAV